MTRQERAYALLSPTPEAPGRVEDWRWILDTQDVERPRVPIRSATPQLARLPIGVRLVYEVDDTRLSAAQRGRMVTALCARFGVSGEEVVATLDVQPVALLADRCRVEVPA